VVDRGAGRWMWCSGTGVEGRHTIPIERTKAVPRLRRRPLYASVRGNYSTVTMLVDNRQTTVSPAVTVIGGELISAPEVVRATSRYLPEASGGS
jgi:hypothetical protein